MFRQGLIDDNSIFAHPVGSSVDSSCSSLDLSWSLERVGVITLFIIIILFIKFVIVEFGSLGSSWLYINATYNQRASVWFYEHPRHGRENTSTFPLGRPQSSPRGRKPWKFCCYFYRFKAIWFGSVFFFWIDSFFWLTWVHSEQF